MITAIELVVFTILVTLASAFFINLGKKWGVVEWLQVHGSELISKMANCNFCLSFWTSLVICSALAFYTGSYELLLVPIFSTSITRLLV